jgi:hypothetical protein
MAAGLGATYLNMEAGASISSNGNYNLEGHLWPMTGYDLIEKGYLSPPGRDDILNISDLALRRYYNTAYDQTGWIVGHGISISRMDPRLNSGPLGVRAAMQEVSGEYVFGQVYTNVHRYYEGLLPVAPYGLLLTIPDKIPPVACSDINTFVETDGHTISGSSGTYTNVTSVGDITGIMQSDSMNQLFRSDNVFLSASRINKGYQLVLADPGYLFAESRSAGIQSLIPLDKWNITDIIRNETITPAGNSLNVMIPAGGFRILHIQKKGDYLSAITWPDKPDDFNMPEWKGDTIPGFSPLETEYVVTLPYGTTDVPALTAIPEIRNSGIEIQRATSLQGNMEERTTLVTCYAPEDSTSRTYSVRFDVEKPSDLVQKYQADPFFSKIMANLVAYTGYVELTNPGNVDLDLSNYMIIRSMRNTDPVIALTGELAPTPQVFGKRYTKYIPGYKWTSDTANWIAQPGVALPDTNVDPVLEGGKSFVMAAFWGREDRDELLTSLIGKYDVNFYSGHLPGMECTWGDEDRTIEHREYASHSQTTYGGVMFLFRILNDSVREGKKPVGDPDDFELIDAMGEPAMAPPGTILMGGTNVRVSNTLYMRKPHIYKGNTDPRYSFNTTEDSDSVEWIPWLINNPFTREELIDPAGVHDLNPVKVYRSTVTSDVYLVSEGYESPQAIKGDMRGTKIPDVLSNLKKADEGQSLLMLSGVTGEVKTDSDTVAFGDTLVVTSADRKNVTSYIIDPTPFSSDALLVAREGSGLRVEANGSTGIISGMDYGTTLQSVVDGLIKPDGSTMNIIDEMDHPVPFRVRNYDTVLADNLAGDDIRFEVKAEDGTVITYRLYPNAAEGDAFVTSGLYAVDQEVKTISLIPRGLFASVFLKDIIPVRGAVVTITDSNGSERIDGTLMMDDKLKVVSGDGKNMAVYDLNFLCVEADYNRAPQVKLAFADTAVTVGSFIDLTAFAEDDGLPCPGVPVYAWSVVGGAENSVSLASPGALNCRAGFKEAGVYNLRISVNDGELSSHDTIKVTVNLPSVSEDWIIPDLRIYPNPAGELVTLELPGLAGQEILLKVFNITGKLVIEKKLSEEKMDIDISFLDTGLYFIWIESKELMETRKLSVIR